jgi:hypothetical protein
MLLLVFTQQSPVQMHYRCLVKALYSSHPMYGYHHASRTYKYLHTPREVMHSKRSLPARKKMSVIKKYIKTFWKSGVSFHNAFRFMQIPISKRSPPPPREFVVARNSN